MNIQKMYIGEQYDSLSESQKARIMNLLAIEMGAGIIGSIGGAIYAHRTGGKWYRYIGYWILFGAITGLVAKLAITPFENKIIAE